MIQTYAHQKQLHEARLDIKSLECLFSNQIVQLAEDFDLEGIQKLADELDVC
ncbi:MAG: hypothetical protein GY755_22250 [Chloroflexi bacterium]|nr:hypothetical protein [Chloroflexota bacterium]